MHEFALAFLPLMLSDKVRAGEEFLIPGYNGFRFRAKDLEDLKKALEKVFSMDEAALRQMGSRSRRLAERYSPELWARRLMSVRDENA